MKGFMIVITGVLLLSAFTSCKNNYQCSCFLYNNDSIKRFDTAFGKMLNKDAIYYCDKVASDFAAAVARGAMDDTIRNCNLNKVN